MASPACSILQRDNLDLKTPKGDLILGNFGDSEAQDETFLESVPSRQATDSSHREHKYSELKIFRKENRRPLNDQQKPMGKTPPPQRRWPLELPNKNVKCWQK